MESRGKGVVDNVDGKRYISETYNDVHEFVRTNIKTYVSWYLYPYRFSYPDYTNAFSFNGFSTLREIHLMLTSSLLYYVIEQYRRCVSPTTTTSVDGSENDRKKSVFPIICGKAEFMEVMLWYGVSCRYHTLNHEWFRNIGDSLIREYGYLQTGERLRVTISNIHG